MYAAIAKLPKQKIVDLCMAFDKYTHSIPWVGDSDEQWDEYFERKLPKDAYDSLAEIASATLDSIEEGHHTTDNLQCFYFCRTDVSKGSSLHHAVDTYCDLRVGFGAHHDAYNEERLLNSFFTILDARHMPVTSFWRASLIRFFREDKSRRDLVRFVQIMQYFPEVQGEYSDFFDRQNGVHFLLYSLIRDGVQGSSSCGTNAVWHMGYWADTLRDQEPERFHYSAKSKIEDTETTNELFLRGEQSIYCNKPLVYGIAKSYENYFSSIKRWSEGSVELFFFQFFKFFIGLFLSIAYPAALSAVCIITMETQVYVWGMVAIPVLAFTFVVLANKHEGLVRYCIAVSNLTYWITSITSVYWIMILPVGIILTAALDSQFKMNNEVILFGGLVLSFLQAMAVECSKWWGHTSELQIWRSFQMWAISWVVHVQAIFSAIRTVIWKSFGKKAATGWSVNDFEFKVMKMVLILQVLGMVTAILYAVLQLMRSQFGISVISSNTTVSYYLVGVVLTTISLYSIWEPFWVTLRGRPLFLSARHNNIMLLVGFLILYGMMHGSITDFFAQISVFIPHFS